MVCIGSEARLVHCDFDIETVSSNTAIGMQCEQSESYAFTVHTLYRDGTDAHITQYIFKASKLTN